MNTPAAIAHKTMADHIRARDSSAAQSRSDLEGHETLVDNSTLNLGSITVTETDLALLIERGIESYIAEAEGLGEDYILVEGGLVQNSPRLPVFDLDVLDSDSADLSYTVEQAFELYKNIAEHPSAAQDLHRRLEELLCFVWDNGNYGIRAQIAEYCTENQTLLKKLHSAESSVLPEVLSAV